MPRLALVAGMVLVRYFGGVPALVGRLKGVAARLDTQAMAAIATDLQLPLVEAGLVALLAMSHRVLAVGVASDSWESVVLGL